MKMLNKNGHPCQTHIPDQRDLCMPPQAHLKGGAALVECHYEVVALSTDTKALHFGKHCFIWHHIVGIFKVDE
jgi:hypothetical protein